MDNTSNWDSVEGNIKRHEGGCWTWAGAPVQCNVYRLVAEAYGTPLPARQKLYRMPNCKVGKQCVNPNHLGTGEDFVHALKGQRRGISDASKTVAGVNLTPQDKRFLKSLNIGWE